MTSDMAVDSVLEFNRFLLDAGAALHWLVPGDKMPIEPQWSDAPRYTAEQLRNKHRAGANIGVRFGEPSNLSGYFLHIIDIDIRSAEFADAAWSALLKLCPGARSLPSVISGSGGESRHLYFLTDKPFRKKKLAKSAGFADVWNEKKQKNVKKNDWEIDIMGTGSQAVLPPSIHPDTKLPYKWERPLDLSMIGIGMGPILPSATVAAWGVDESSQVSGEDDDDDLDVIFAAAPMQLDDGQLEKILADLPEDWVDDRDAWLTVGAALHHQFEGKREGFEMWCEWSSKSPKFDRKDSARVWHSFKGKLKPVRVATLIQAASANRMSQEMDFEDATDDGFGDEDKPETGTALALVPEGETSLADLLSLDVPKAAPTVSNGVEIDPDWMTLLHRNEDGELKSTIHNVALIIRNDKRTAGIVAFNEFTQEFVLRGTPGRVRKKRDKSKPVINLDGPIWELKDTLNGDNWTDSHDINIRRMIEAPTTQGGYGIKVSERDLLGGINLSAMERQFHPVREKLEEAANLWDGKKRIETFFIDYLGCADTPYHRKTSVLTLLGGVSRIFEPGHKFDFVPILEGAQGAGKSTFIYTLGMGWTAGLNGDISKPQEMVGLMAGQWIMELGELSSMQRSEVNDLKDFVTKPFDKARPPYGKRTIVYKRQCIFVGSTNDGEYLRDATGNRRYWPIVCNLNGLMIDNIKLREELMQIWGEAVHAYRAMRQRLPIGDLPLYLDDKESALEAKAIQESKRVETAEDALGARIVAWLEKPILSGDGFDGDDQPRKVTCMNQIWSEILERTGPIPHNEAIKIGKAMQGTGWFRSPSQVRHPELTKKYGLTRVYFADKDDYLKLSASI